MPLPIEPKGTLRPMLRPALPVLAEQFLATLVMYSDTILAGHYLDQSALAAMALLAYFMWLLTGLFAFVAIGSLALTARFVGGGDLELARRTTNQSLVAGLVLSLLIGGALVLFLEPTIDLLNAEPEVARLTARYLYFVLPVLPAIMLTQIGPACLRGAGDTVTGMIAMGVVNVVNVAVAWGLICPAWAAWRQSVGLPELGWDGLAVGAAVGYAAGGLLMLVQLSRGRAGLRIVPALAAARLEFDPAHPADRHPRRLRHPDGRRLSALVRLDHLPLGQHSGGGPRRSGADRVAGLFARHRLPGGGGDSGRAIPGARDPRRASHAIWMTCLVGGAVMTAAGAVFYFGGEPLVRIFVSQSQTDVIAMAAMLLKIVAFAMPPFALMAIMLGALRGAGDTRLTMAITTLGFLAVRIPLAYALARVWPLGVYGAWYAMLADLCVRCALVCSRFRQGGWKRVAV